jgi:hypothetical protein
MNCGHKKTANVGSGGVAAVLFEPSNSVADFATTYKIVLRYQYNVKGNGGGAPLGIAYWIVVYIEQL